MIVVLIRDMNTKAALLAVLQIPAVLHQKSFSELFLDLAKHIKIPGEISLWLLFPFPVKRPHSRAICSSKIIFPSM